MNAVAVSYLLEIHVSFREMPVFPECYRWCWRTLYEVFSHCYTSQENTSYVYVFPHVYVGNKVFASLKFGFLL